MMKTLTYLPCISVILLAFSFPHHYAGPTFGMANTEISIGGRMASTWQYADGVITVYADDCSLASNNEWRLRLTSTGSAFDAIVHEPYIDCEGPCSSEITGSAEYFLAVDGQDAFSVLAEEVPTYPYAQNEIAIEVKELVIQYCGSQANEPEYGTDKLIFPITGTYDDFGTPQPFSGQVEVLIDVHPNDPLRKRNLASQAMSLFPNPAQNRMIVQFDEQLSANSTLVILDLQGKQVLQEVITDQAELSLDVSSLQSGMYICEWKTETELVREKFLKVD